LPVDAHTSQGMDSPRVAYVLATFPSRSETFALREILSVQRLGLGIIVLAANSEPARNAEPNMPPVIYRPPLLGWASLQAVAYIMANYPLGLARLLWLLMKLARESLTDCATLASNIHTICHFTRSLDRQQVRHVHGYFLSWTGTISLAIAALSRRPMSLSSHARDIFVERGAIRTKARSSAFIATCTEQGLARLRELLPAAEHHKLCLVRHGVETLAQEGDPDGSVPHCQDKLLYVGRLVSKKGVEHLLRALCNVRHIRPTCTLRVIGDGPDRRYLEELARSLGLDDSVEWYGWMGNSQVVASMHESTLLVVPSVIDVDGDRDGVPNVILEAFACGLVVVASQLPGIAEAVKHGETGCLAIPGSPSDLSAAISRLLNDVSERRRLSRNAKALLEQEFNLSRNTAAMAKLLRTHAVE